MSKARNTLSDRCVTLLLIFAVTAACTEREPAVSTAVDAGEPRISTKAPTSKRGTVMLGEDKFELDSITCFGTSTATAVATDRANRDGYPTVTLKTFDPEFTGGIDSNTASIQFSGPSRSELWVMHEGSVSKDGNSFHSSGVAKGHQMEPQTDGTLQPKPLTGTTEHPFEITISCR